MRFHSSHIRDSSLRKLSRINRWLVAGSVALTAVFTEAAAHAFSGKATTKTASGAAGKHARSHAKRRHTDGGHSATAPRSLNPPAQAPQSSSEPSTTPEPAPSEAPTEEAPQQSAPAEAAAPEPEISHESTPESQPAQEAPVVSGGS
jgi:hypothetical protein